MTWRLESYAVMPEQTMFADGTTPKPTYIRIKQPTMGNKIHCIRTRGLFVLEVGPTTFQGMACMHGGSGGYRVFDGVPNEDGFFPEAPKPPIERNGRQWEAGEYVWPDGTIKQLSDEEAKQACIEYEVAFYNRNGREVVYSNPAQMGMWVMQGNCQHGLCVWSSGEHQGATPNVTVTWLPVPERLLKK